MATSNAESSPTDKVTPEDFVAAFNNQRTTLAGFASCSNKKELDVVRDGFYLGLAKDLCPDAYKAVLILILRKKFGNTKGENHKTSQGHGLVEEGNQGILSMSFEEMVLAARACDDTETSSPSDETTHGENTETNTDESNGTETNNNPTSYWKDLVDTVLSIGKSVGSDLESIWKTLEDGRLAWLKAASVAHPIKVLLKKALQDDNALDSAGDVSDAMMVWIYSICLALVENDTVDEETSRAPPTNAREQLSAAVDKWVTAVNMTDKHNPLKGYQAELWDPRRDEWRALDLAAQQAAESGGANLVEAWKA